MTPKFYKRYILPELKKDVQMVHEAGSKFAIVTSAAYTPLLDYYLASEIDVLIGLDPVQDSQVDFKLIKQKINVNARLATMPGRIIGRVTCQKTLNSLAPKDRAASSIFGSILPQTAETNLTTNGKL